MRAWASPAQRARWHAREVELEPQVAVVQALDGADEDPQVPVLLDPPHVVRGHGARVPDPRHLRTRLRWVGSPGLLAPPPGGQAPRVKGSIKPGTLRPPWDPLPIPGSPRLPLLLSQLGRRVNPPGTVSLSHAPVGDPGPGTACLGHVVVPAHHGAQAELLGGARARPQRQQQEQQRRHHSRLTPGRRVYRLRAAVSGPAALPGQVGPLESISAPHAAKCAGHCVGHPGLQHVAENVGGMPQAPEVVTLKAEGPGQ